MYGIIEAREETMGTAPQKATGISIDESGVLRFENGIEAIPPCAFRCRDDFQEVVLPETIRTIGDQAFSNCHNLKLLELPCHLASMGEHAFSNCGIREISIPGSLACIPQNAFSACDNLQAITVREGVESIGSQAFADCGRPLRVNLPNSIKQIANNAFDLTTLTPAFQRVELCARKSSFAHKWALSHPTIAEAV